MDFSPSVYEHAAFLIGRTPWEVSRDADLLFEAHAEAFRRYGHAPVVVGIDIYNLEAILQTGTGMVICPIETDQEAFMRKIRDRPGVRVRINTSSQVMVHGTRGELRGELERIVRLTAGRANVCLGTGALPYETPPESVLWLRDLCEGHRSAGEGHGQA